MKNLRHLLPLFALASATVHARDLSFIETVAVQGAAVREAHKGAQLFEVNTYLNIEADADSNADDARATVHGQYSLPKNDVEYLGASTALNGGRTRMEKQGYVLRQCGGARMDDCGKPTGEAEDASFHAPFKRWRADRDDILAAAKELGFTGSAKIKITSKARYLAFRDRDWSDPRIVLSSEIFEAIRSMPYDEAIIVIEGRTEKRNHLAVLTGKGEAIQSWDFDVPPPPPGVVSSGGG